MIFTFYKIIKLILFTSIKIDLIFFYYGGFMFVSIFLLASFKIAYVFPLRTLSLYIKFLVFLFIKITLYLISPLHGILALQQ